MAALPEYVRFYTSKVWADLPQKTTPIIAAALAHWDDWHGRIRDRVEEIADKVALLDAGGVNSLPRPAGAAQTGALFVEQSDGTVKRLARSGNNLILGSGTSEPLWTAPPAPLPTVSTGGYVLASDATGKWSALAPSTIPGTVLMADPLTPAGIAWGDPAAGAFVYNEAVSGVVASNGAYWDRNPNADPSETILASRVGKAVTVTGHISVVTQQASPRLIRSGVWVLLATLPPSMRPSVTVTNANVGNITATGVNNPVSARVESNGNVSFSLGSNGYLTSSGAMTPVNVTLFSTPTTYVVP